MPSAAEAIEELIRTPPDLHITEEGPQPWTLGAPALRWLAANVEEGWTTLETGCGHSSIIFALKGCRHTIVAPTRDEHQRVRRWCEERGFSTEHVTSLVDISQAVLPGLDGALDFGLIDGDHAFPTPLIDWYYIAARLRVNGFLMIDDLQLPTSELLYDFLVTEDERWGLEVPLGKAAVFRKLTDEPPIPASGWCGQPWAVKGAERAARRERRPWVRLRRVLRPRTRLRALIRRVRS